jgi:hypothetical protein
MTGLLARRHIAVVASLGVLLFNEPRRSRTEPAVPPVSAYAKDMTGSHDPLRNVLALAVERDGITRVAQEAAVNAESLRKYLSGAPVRSDVLTALTDWASPTTWIDDQGDGPYFGSGS